VNATVQALNKVSHGLGVLIAGLPLLLLFALYSTLLILHSLGLIRFPFAGEDVPSLPALHTWGIVLLGVSLLGLQLAGQLLCLAVPREVKGRNLLQTAIALNGLALGIDLVVLIPDLPPSVHLLSVLSSLVAQIPLLLFLRRLAHFLSEGEAETRAETTIVLLLLFILLPGLIVFVLQRLPALGVVFGYAGFFALMVVGVLLSAFLLIRFVNLLLDLHHAIRRHVETILQQEKYEGG
jgi:hypothetical protein